jgi:lipopolysaccharide export system protein LptA
MMRKISVLAPLAHMLGMGCVVAGLWVHSAHAAQPEFGKRDEPIEITADKLEVLQDKQKAMFQGNVIARQGEVMLKAATMTVYYRQAPKTEAKGAAKPAQAVDNVSAAAGAVSRIEADGGVLLTTKEETARGARGVYHVDEKKVTMSGDVVLTRGQNVLKGALLVYDFATGRSELTSGVSATASGKSGDAGAGNGRIRALFVPEKK